jgi:glycosyltransferase involved in cell wall biosynthesis
VADAFLNSCYHEAAVLISASHGEGYGLPLIEAARRGLPIIASDLPVSREVCGEGAMYFRTGDADDLIRALREMTELQRGGAAPDPAKVKVHSWEESAQILLNVIGGRWDSVMAPAAGSA